MESLWGRFLGHERLYIRWRALRVAETSALLDGPSFDREGERYPYIWALSSQASSGQLESRRDDLALRARFLVRRQARARTWKRRLSRPTCAQAVLDSRHPIETLACVVRLLEMHGAEAIQPLLEIVRIPPPRLQWDDRAECAAWALGRLGRVAVPEILQEFRDGSQRVRRHLCTALWYLGPAAGSRAAALLVQDHSEYSTAALLAMESAASLAMVQARRGPIWLDSQAVRALAELAFSEKDRSYAAVALGCFGPAYLDTLPILDQLAQDPAPEVRLNLARGLQWGGRPDALGVLYLLCRDENEGVAESAREAVSGYDSQLVDWDLILSRGGPWQRRRLAQYLAEVGAPARLDDLVLKRLLDSEPEFVVSLLGCLERRNPLPKLFLPAIQLLLEEDGPVRLAAARLALGWGDDPELGPLWQRLLWDSDLEVACLAATAVGRSGRPLAEWGLKKTEMLRLPALVLARLLEEMGPGVMAAREFLPLLARREVGARLAAVLTLRECKSPEVLRALRGRLRDPSDSVAVASARALIKHGQAEHGWVLLRSDLAEVREKTAGWLAKHGRPRGLDREYTSGRCYNLETLRLLPARRRAELVLEAFLKLRQPCASHLVELGPPAMDWMPQLLGHRRLVVRSLAIEALVRLLPLEGVQAWLARHGHRLPLDLAENARGPEQRLLDRLHRLLLEHCPAIEGSPIWLSVSRSEYWDTASRGLQILAQGSGSNPAFVEGLLDGLGHFEPQVRRFTLELVDRHLPRELWHSQAESQEAKLLMVARHFGQASVEPVALQRAVEQLGQWGLQATSLLRPSSPSQLLALVSCAGSSESFDRVAPHLMAAYTGKTDPELNNALRTLVRTHPAYHTPLASRWPKLTKKDKQ
jgi:HEAT repeat protein